MSIRVRALRAVGAVTCAAALGLVPTVNASATPPPPPPPVVTVTITNNAISFSGGNHLAAGTTVFRAVTPNGARALQIVRLHQGYSYQQATHDLGTAFQGDVAAVRRVDDKIDFLGGVNSAPGRPGYFSQRLPAGNYYAIDTNDPDPSTATHAAFTVSGSPHQTAPVPHGGQVTAFSYGFGNYPTTLPHAGTNYFFNQSDQPHFLVMIHVKQSTTGQQVRDFIKSGHGQPPFALPGGDSTGVISPYVGQNWQYDVTPGKYLLACFWPDDHSGMPHFNMGMWKLVQLT